VYLPVHERRAPEPPGPAAVVEPGAATPNIRRRLLLVDDNEDTTEMLAAYFTTLGYVTRTAHDGPSALTLLDEFTPDAAVLDIGLPVMDGYELARRIRERVATVRLVAVTGYGRPSDQERAAAAGFDAHLVKPIDIEALATLVRRADAP